MAFNPRNGTIYVANWGAGTISVISDLTNKITSTIKVGNNPWGVLYDPQNQKIYVAGYTSGMFKIDPMTNKVVETFAAGNGPWNIAVNTSNKLLYVTNLGSDTVTVISP
jgi:YVTN family beta-propeller protein